MKKYKPQKIEVKWRKMWAKDPLMYTADPKSKKRKFYCLDMFPYPSGDGLHVGHVESYTATDIFSRYKRMQGFNVIHPMGWDAFGLPAENYAIKTGIHPAKSTAQRIGNFRRQMNMLGFSYDWSREINSSSPEYYKWTQWFFLFLYKRGLAYKAKAKANWCPHCQTTIANEQVVGGRCERCDTQVIQKELDQWFFRTTAYAKRLLEDLDAIDWPDSIKEMQRNWIGKSEGMEIVFEVKKIKPEDEKYVDCEKYSTMEMASQIKQFPTVGYIKVFTTRPDTIFGSTFLALAPESKIVPELEQHITNLNKIKAYQLTAAKKNELERGDLNKQKTGVKIEGLIAINPANTRPIPIWMADYVMGDYGSGAAMAVPAHDTRDFEFAFNYQLPVERVNYQQQIFRAFLDLAFVENPNEVVETLKKKKFQISFLNLTNEGFTLSSSISEENPYGIIVEIGDEKSVKKYIKVIQKFLKESLWTEISGGKYLTFVFQNSVIKDESKEDRKEIQANLKKALKIISKLREYDPRFHQLKKVINSKHFYPDFVSWTIPAGPFRDLVCYAQKEGFICNSAFLEGMSIERGWEKIADWITEKQIGSRAVNYRLRDWLVSRQRYWGAPIPIVYCPNCGIVPVPEKDLPVELPKNVDFVPTGESPLKNLSSFLNTKCPKCGENATREVDTMDTFVCSSWYYFRFCDPKNDREFSSQELIRRFMPVDLYIGGAEHAVLHLLYSRFFNKVLQDAGYVDFSEPFQKLRNQGIILGPDHNKMSKSKGNVINPDDIVKEIGADSLRIYEMFMGPLEDMKPWDTKGIQGARRFLEKVWQMQEKVRMEELTEEDLAKDPEFYKENAKAKKALHRTIKKVTEDIESLSFNTAISQMMIMINEWRDLKSVSKEDFEAFLKILSPFAPYICEELWEIIGNNKSIFYEMWPQAIDTWLKVEEVEVIVQINGKKRASVSLSPNISEEEAREIIFGLNKVVKYIEGHSVRKWIYVPGRIANIVTD